MDKPEMRSLSSKLKEHYNNRDFTTKPETMDKLGKYAFWVMTLLLFGTAVFIFIPALYEGKTAFCLTLVCVFLLIEQAINWVLIVRNGCSKGLGRTEGRLSNGALKENWSTCVKCQADAPPRSHHCRLCKVCIPKQDHHCYFAGTCVGHFNQRYFIVTLSYTIMGAVLSVYLNYNFIDMHMPFRENPLSYFPIVFVWRWLTGSLLTGYLLLLVLAYVTAGFLVGALMYAFMQAYLLNSGQTPWEASHGVTRYNMGLACNLRAVFGNYWMLNFLLPLSSKQGEDGHNWPTQKSIKGN